MKTSDYPNWLVPLDIANKLKELNFNLNCYFYREEGRDGNDLIKSPFSLSKDTLRNYNKSYYDTSTSIPTFDQVIGWFNNRGLFGVIEYEGSEIYTIRIIIKGTPSVRTNNIKYCSYQEAKLGLINELIELYENQTSKLASTN